MSTIDLIRCGKCRHSRGWRDLVVVRVIEREELALHVVKWPADVAVQVRRCTCGAEIARLARGDANGSASRLGAVA